MFKKFHYSMLIMFFFLPSSCPQLNRIIIIKCCLQLCLGCGRTRPNRWKTRWSSVVPWCWRVTARTARPPALPVSWFCPSAWSCCRSTSAVCSRVMPYLEVEFSFWKCWVYIYNSIIGPWSISRRLYHLSLICHTKKQNTLVLFEICLF